MLSSELFVFCPRWEPVNWEHGTCRCIIGFVDTRQPVQHSKAPQCIKPNTLLHQHQRTFGRDVPSCHPECSCLSRADAAVLPGASGPSVNARACWVLRGLPDIQSDRASACAQVSRGPRPPYHLKQQCYGEWGKGGSTHHAQGLPMMTKHPQTACSTGDPVESEEVRWGFRGCQIEPSRAFTTTRNSVLFADNRMIVWSCHPNCLQVWPLCPDQAPQVPGCSERECGCSVHRLPGLIVPPRL